MNQVRNLNTACQIFIGCLHQSVVEPDLYNLTANYGQVVHIRILRNIYTKEPMGLAFVSFSDPASAQRARTELNGVEFKGKHINVTLYYKPRNPSANIFVNNLPPECMARDLEEIFKQFGPIVSAKVSYDPSLNSNRYGYIQYEKEEHALSALNSKDQIFGSTKIQVSKFIPIKDRNDPQNNPNLYVRGFGSSFTQDSLFKLFSSFGEVSSHVIMRDGDKQGGDRYFAYVCFQNPEYSQRAISSLHQKEVEGITWFVVPHLKRAARRKKLEVEYKLKKESWKKRNLFLKNLPIIMNENMLKQLCQEYGDLESVKIHMTENITYQDGQKVPQLVSNGSAFVCYVAEESARKALSGLRNKMVDGKNIIVSMWKPREELVKNLNAKRVKMIQRQMMEVGVFNPMYSQQMIKPGRGRGFPQVPQIIPPMMSQMIPRPIPERVPQNRLPFDNAGFQNATPEAQRRILGEQLYPIVLKNSNEKVAGKITGMLLEIETKLLLSLMQNPIEVVNKVKEALEVLRKAWFQNPELLATLP
jgi:polyadenylate-binding protein